MEIIVYKLGETSVFFIHFVKNNPLLEILKRRNFYVQ
nr:MAG TPA: hypothetical protein [Caudoviricetes sp.]